ncbi:MAG: M23 family metallopeptidase [Anaerolineales bacterium]|nr:M23 family metallopeptidase [Anaerolineales bacterium]
MKSLFPIFILLVLASCNAPIQSTPVEATSTFIIPNFTQTLTPTIEPTFTSIPPSPTSTPIPCDPLTSDYCITEFNFLFQRPILPPDNDSVDISYPYASTQNGRRDPHHGVEFQNEFGTPVYAAGDGEVVFADTDKEVKFSQWSNFYGNLIVIKHDNNFYTLYAHLSAILVKVGDKVSAGNLIGQVGQTGGATGSHLHFEVRYGGDMYDRFSTQNPELFFIPKNGTGALLITLNTPYDRNYEYPLVITRLVDNFVYYINSYTKGFEVNPEDAVLNNLPQGDYRIAFNDQSGLNERFVKIEDGKLTVVVFEVK